MITRWSEDKWEKTPPRLAAALTELSVWGLKFRRSKVKTEQPFMILCLNSDIDVICTGSCACSSKTHRTGEEAGPPSVSTLSANVSVCLSVCQPASAAVGTCPPCSCWHLGFISPFVGFRRHGRPFQASPRLWVTVSTDLILDSVAVSNSRACVCVCVRAGFYS